MIVIINYKMGNLQSVANMLDFLGIENKITDQVEEIRKADKIILPGVGAFGQAMKNINELGLVEVLKEEVLTNKKPFLGICLGMQLIADKGYEGGENIGLGFIPGEVRLMKPKDKSLRIPHVGWNDVMVKGDTKMYGHQKGDRVFYFVHSYHFVPQNESDVSGLVEYGGDIVASLLRDNIWATQFHPEKSQKDGIELLKNFIKL
jgi:imidazole glycerol-phosphate synthase subunit HisH